MHRFARRTINRQRQATINTRYFCCCMYKFFVVVVVSIFPSGVCVYTCILCFVFCCLDLLSSIARRQRQIMRLWLSFFFSFFLQMLTRAPHDALKSDTPARRPCPLLRGNHQRACARVSVKRCLVVCVCVFFFTLKQRSSGVRISTGSTGLVFTATYTEGLLLCRSCYIWPP